MGDTNYAYYETKAGYKIVGKTDDDIVVANGGTIPKSTFALSTDLSNYMTLNTEQITDARKAFSGATNNFFYGAAVETRGNGSSNTIYPSIGFHQPTLFGGTISMRDSNQFYFRNIDDSSFVYLGAAGYRKAGSDDNKVLLGGGGDKQISDFWNTGNFNPDTKVNKSGDTMTGGLIINTPDSIGSGNLGILPQNYKLFLSNGAPNYGTVFWTEGTGQGYIQQQRSDGTASSYRLNLQPYGGELYYGSSEVATQGYVSSNYVKKSGDTMTGDLHALNITAQNASDTLTYDNLVNYGSPLKINANASLGIYLQANGTDILYVGPSFISSYRDLHMESNTVIYTSSSNSNEWQRAYTHGLVDRGAAFESNVDANALPNQTGITAIETGNGSGNTNFPNNNTYGTFLKMSSRSFTSEFFHENSGDLYHRNWYLASTPSVFRKIWDDVNLPSPASTSDLSSYVPYTGATSNIDINSKNLSTTGSIYAGGLNSNIFVSPVLAGGSFVINTNATELYFGNTLVPTVFYQALGSHNFFVNGVNKAIINAGGLAVTGALSLNGQDVATQPWVNANYTPISHVGSGGTAHANATTSTAGFMSSADKVKLDNIDTSNFVTRGNTDFTQLQEYREIDDTTLDIGDSTVEKFNIVFDASSNGHVVIHSLTNGQMYMLHNFSAANSIELEVEGYGVVDSINAGESKTYMAYGGGHLRRINSVTNDLII